ncbi:jg5832 [Pararge aegeria aegeria]|uniref:Jg5832 protein n=1 Tax=Pararge aegeria aegeria TaxID=348720 RepID=A0A8S4RAP2_9NEOP|nr:jg5832 [Pararge aegeria aegeria]
MHKTGATRHQKFQKAEKAKTKLKGKKDKELPKGTNITKTNFKVKKIVIKEQLKKHGQSEALSTRKLNIKELLSRLNHFNTNSRTDALDGLKELINAHPDVLEQNLGQLINAVTTLILNIEKKVRQEALKVLHLILSNVPPEKVEPFFDIMSTYLRSSMTHIDSRIQEDSLLFLDILLLCAPLRVAQDFHRIIPNFLDMISKLRVDSKPGRTLTINLNNQNTSAKWRVKVFQRLQEFLQKYAAYKNVENLGKIKTSGVTVFDVIKPNYYSLFDPINTSNCTVSCFSGKSSENELQIDEIEKFHEYTHTLVPLLFETWFEACPSSKSDKNFETVISEETGQLLKHIIQTLTLLKNLLKYFNTKCPSSHVEKLLLQKYKSKFSQHFMTSFPYVTNMRSRQVSRMDTTGVDTTDPKLIAVNLELCQLYIAFNPYVNLKNQSNEISLVLGYIEKIFNQSSDSTISAMVINLLNSLFRNEITGWTRTISVLDALFRKIIWIYFNKSMCDTLKQDIFGLLCKITLNENLSHFHSNDAFEMWLKSLPDILLSEKLTVQTVNIIHKFAVTRNDVFNSILKPKLLAIIKNFPKLAIINSDVEPGCYHKLLSIFYWIKVWDNESLNLLEKQLIDNVYKPDHIKYIFDTLRLRSGGIL